MIDPLEVGRMEIRDHGEEVVVTLAGQQPLPAIRMLFDDGIENARLGGLPGHMAQQVFRCLPEDDPGLVEGSVINVDGTLYGVIDVLRRRNCLTDILVNER